MGRRSVSVQDESRWVFNRLADAYRYRPGYPDEVAARVMTLLGTKETGPIVDLGAGTGLWTRALVDRGAHVIAVEPARRMLQSLMDPSGADTRQITPVHASAEDTGLPEGSAAAVTLADALHWMDPELAGREAHRLLRLGGLLAVVEPRFADTPLMAGLQALLTRRNPKAARRAPSSSLGLFFRLGTGRPGPVEQACFVQHLELSTEALQGVVRSFSFAGPALGPEQLEALLRDVDALAVQHGHTFSREIHLYWGFRR